MKLLKVVKNAGEAFEKFITMLGLSLRAQGFIRLIRAKALKLNHRFQNLKVNLNLKLVRALVRSQLSQRKAVRPLKIRTYLS